jgi:hypothetical protein
MDKIYSLSIAATRVNNDGEIFPYIDKDGFEHNMSCKTINLFDDMKKVRAALQEYYDKECEFKENKVVMSTRISGSDFSGEVFSQTTDTCGNVWTTIVKVSTMRIKNDIHVSEEVRASYI